jgi:hypothetical protein
MEKEFVPYELSLELKQLGMDLGWYNYLNFYDSSTKEFCFVMKDVPAPLYQQAFRWFRDNHNLFGCIDLQCSNPAYWYIRVDDIIENDFVYHSEDYRIKYKTYEEAESDCINKLIELVKKS